MKKPGKFIKHIRLILPLLVLLLPTNGIADPSMSNYCIVPPFIQETAKPNLLLMFDNSASVFDLAYIDKGSASRQSSYCYDQTFTNQAGYLGYFDTSSYYVYDMVNRYFSKIDGITNLTGYTCTISDSQKNNLCLDHDGATPPVITAFRASGKYLNWLAASKFDIQKWALTGGKYDGQKLIPESRGCVGRGFVKEPLTDNYVEGGANTGLGVTMQVRGAPNTSNYSSPSTGGLTQFSVFNGNYNQPICQAAIDAYAAGHDPADIKKAVDACLTSIDSTATSSLETDQKVVFQQTIQECWQYSRMADPKTVGSDAVSTVTGKCGSKNGVYDKRGAGPSTIGPGDADQICSDDYAGYCFAGSKSDSWNTWVKKEYASPNDCIIAKHNQFCSDLDVVPVTDPTDSPSVTSDFANLPAMIADIGIAAQLGDPLKLSNGDDAFFTRLRTDKSPSGIVQEFAGKLRLGGMKFNEYGSQSEAATDLIPATKVCSTNISQQCGWDRDCPPRADGTISGTCSASGNKDGAAVFHYIGIGHCSVNTGTACTTKANCPAADETCIPDPVGDYSTADGFIKKINEIKGATWTPFGEAYYNAIGYFAKDTSDTSGKKSKISLRLNDDDFLAERNPSEYRCQPNNILVITDGVSTADRHTDVKNLSDKNTAPGSSSQTCSYFAGSTYLENLAWLAKNFNINSIEKNTKATTAHVKNSEFITTYTVFNGSSTGVSGDCDAPVLLNKTAENGGTTPYSALSYDLFIDNLRQAFSAAAGGSASGTAASILSNSEGSGANILQAVFYPMKEFESATQNDPKTKAAWIGELQNLWYYVDPYIENSSVREDTDYSGSGAHTLHLQNDKVAQFVFDSNTNDTKAKLYTDTDGNGSGDVLLTNSDDSRVSTQGGGVVLADAVKSIWRAGRLLWDRDLSASPKRKLYTNLAGATATGCTGSFPTSPSLVDLVAFDWAANADNSCILQKHLNAATLDEAKNIIKYTQGYDHADYDPSPSAITGTIDGKRPRSRTVRRTLGGDRKVWKLGDIVSSTPRVQSSNKLNNYHQDTPVGYDDATYADDTTGKGFANSTSYKDRGMVYTGANDGLLHAFNMGKLSVNSSGFTKATLSGDNLGREEWAFIPKDVLPYLKYLADPAYSGNNHIYLVDGPSRIVDASIGAATLSATGAYATGGCGEDSSGDELGGGKTVKNYWACKRDGSQVNNKSWRTILTGSMGIGGASANNTSTCSTSTDCVQTPIDGVGYSSYYALDVTDPANPTFMWDFKDSAVGFSTSGAAIVRVAHSFQVGGTTYKDTNGRWFAVIGNGPTGPINTTTNQHLGRSTNPLKLFVLDLRNGTLLKTLVPYTGEVSSAFVGSIGPGAIDVNRSEKLSSSFYSDDAVYAGYSQCTADCTGASPTWDGGVLRLLTKDTDSATNTNSIYPKDWNLSILTSGIGPVTAAVGKLQDRKNRNLWLYAGTGRYFFKDDDKANYGRLIGIKDPCFQMDRPYGASHFNEDGCRTAIPLNNTNFLSQTTLDSNAATNILAKSGWYINLDVQDTDNDFGAERVITDPVAMSNGAVFFTSFMPSTDVCNFGGKSYMWGVKYDTGGVASASSLHGKALVQVSTGSFEELNLATAFSAQDGTVGRKTVNPMVGKPPVDPPPIVSAAGNKPLKRIIHVQEK